MSEEADKTITTEEKKHQIDPVTEKAGPEKKKRKHSRRKYEDLEPADEKDSEDEEDGDKDVDDDKLVVEDDEEDDLVEIDASNIIATGRRTRGKVIDYSKIEAELEKEEGKSKEEVEEEDEDDNDFEDKPAADGKE